MSSCAAFLLPSLVSSLSAGLIDIYNVVGRHQHVFVAERFSPSRVSWNPRTKPISPKTIRAMLQKFYAQRGGGSAAAAGAAAAAGGAAGSAGSGGSPAAGDSPASCGGISAALRAAAAQHPQQQQQDAASARSALAAKAAEKQHRSDAAAEALGGLEAAGGRVSEDCGGFEG